MVFALTSVIVAGETASAESRPPTPELELRIMKKISEDLVRNLGSNVEHSMTATQDLFKIMCPIGLDCPSATYSLFLTAENEDSNLMLVFDKSNLQDMTLQELEKTFSYGKAGFNLNSKLGDSRYELVTLDLDVTRKENRPKWNLTAVEDGRLQGYLSVSVPAFLLRRVDAWGERNCNVQDVNPPPGCLEQIGEEFEYKVRFDIKLPTKSVECSKVKSFENTPPECG